MSVPTTVPEALRAAALFIRERGLAIGEFEKSTGELCALGALRLAVGGKDAMKHPPTRAAVSLYCDSRWSLYDWLVTQGLPDEAVSEWNDRQLEAEAVASGMEAAAALFESREQ